MDGNLHNFMDGAPGAGVDTGDRARHRAMLADFAPGHRTGVPAWILDAVAPSGGGAAVFAGSADRRHLDVVDATGAVAGLVGASIAADRTGGAVARSFRRNEPVTDELDDGDAVTRAQLALAGAPLCGVVPVAIPGQAAVGALAVFGERDLDTDTLSGTGVALALLMPAGPLDAATAPDAAASELRLALATGAIGPHYQPLVDLTSGRVVGAEALARWTRPDGSVAGPGEFLADAQQRGFGPALTATMLGQATDQLARWQSDGAIDDDFKVSINISTSDAAAGAIVSRIAEAIARSGVDAGQVCVELTETEAIANREDVESTLWELRRLGLRIAVDDFGTEHASFSRLTTLPVDIVKIDRSFVTHLPRDRGSLAVVGAVVDVARAQGLDVIAEGIETRAQADTLRDLGVGYGQGFLFGRPVPAAQLADTIRAGR